MIFNFKVIHIRAFFALMLICFVVNGITAQTTFPAFPPRDVNSTMDHDQMLWQLSIQLPLLPPKMEDQNKPLNAWPADKNNPEGNWTDDAKHTITRSAFGLWNNYSDKSTGFFPGADSAKLGDYTPIDLLKMKNGRVITTSDEWWTMRRPEILKDLQVELYGEIPPDSLLPKVTWSEITTKGGKGSSSYIQKEITGTLDISGYPAIRNRPVISAILRTPANAKAAVPVIVVFGGFGNAAETYWARSNPAGWGLCIFNLSVLQPDNGAGLTSYLIGLVNKGNWRKHTDWGTLLAWSWGVSRLIDYFETDRDVNAKIIGLTGHSRFGKATLVTMAYESRIAIGFPSDGGSLGTKMNRRHWGQDLENSTGANEYHWMAGTFFKWAGELFPGRYLPRKIEDCPIDAHSLLALCAPRPMLLNGGTNSSWTDPYGQYLTTVKASPVYELLGGKGIIITDPKPIVDKAYIDGDIAFRYHNGGHTDAPEWPAFFEFASKHFNVPTLTTSASYLTLGSSTSLEATFKISSNKNWLVSCSDKWLKIDSHSSSKNDSVTVSASINRKKARSAILTIESDARKQIILVGQASSKPGIHLSAKELTIGAEANSTVLFDINSNTAWNITGDGNWLTEDEEAGINNKTITLIAASNPRAQKRIGTLIVSSPGLPAEMIKVTQAEGVPVLNISADSINLSTSEGSTASVMITSNTPWILKCSEDWLVANTTSGDGFRQVVFTAKENMGAEGRSAKITISVNGLPPRIIEVFQKARHEE
jgi:hypothetical protein